MTESRLARGPLLQDAAGRAAAYLDGLDARAVGPGKQAVAALAGFRHPLPEEGASDQDVLARLDELGSPATMASAGSRFFGFVVGGSLPATVAASWLATAWDQNAGIFVLSPVAATLEEVALEWLVDVLGLPAGTGGGFVTCATMANFSGLAAARHELLGRAGWDVEGKGLFGAPELKVVVGDEVHVSVLKALGMLGLGRERVVRVPVDGQGRLRTRDLPPLDERTILCLQAGNVNSGSFDEAPAAIAAARAAGAWVHVDGAFGLWARACPSKAPLAVGLEGADSWALDGHKWLNVPYDSGLVFCRRPETLRQALTVTASYLVETPGREPDHFTPEFSRRARGVEVWAALLSLGRKGLSELVERNCRHATRFAEGLRAAGHEVRNDVVLNQVVVSFGDDARTRRVVEAVQAEGTCWCSGTVWQGRASMRISVSGWATTEDDVERSLAAIRRAAG
jgi:glutamate/tyrosine decarboxylase-like PLP-dependent enzyme